MIALIFKLKQGDFEYLKQNAPEAFERISNMKGDEDKSFTVDDIVEFQLDINDAIVENGMNDQDTVNKVGKRLYQIYDELLYQIEHS